MNPMYVALAPPVAEMEPFSVALTFDAPVVTVLPPMTAVLPQTLVTHPVPAKVVLLTETVGIVTVTVFCCWRIVMCTFETPLPER